MQLDDCPVKVALDVVGGKWKPLILYSMKGRHLRYEELRASVPGCTQKVLTEQLRQLQAAGVVERRALPGGGSRAGYRLTPHGQALRPALRALAQWGVRHRERAYLAG